jgi:hypothetical protein
MENFIEFLEKLNPYESEGFACDRLRTLKELLIEFPEKAKLSFEIMDFAGKIYGGELELSFKKRPLGGVSQFFYNEFISIQHWAELQINGINENIESNRKYILTLKKDKEKEFWRNANISLEQDIFKIKTELSKINILSL